MPRRHKNTNEMPTSSDKVTLWQCTLILSLLQTVNISKKRLHDLLRQKRETKREKSEYENIYVVKNIMLSRKIFGKYDEEEEWRMYKEKINDNHKMNLDVCKWYLTSESSLRIWNLWKHKKLMDKKDFVTINEHCLDSFLNHGTELTLKVFFYW